MKQFLSTIRALWAPGGMLIVSILAIGSKEHAGVVASALLCLTILAFSRWTIEAPVATRDNSAQIRRRLPSEKRPPQ